MRNLAVMLLFVSGCLIQDREPGEPGEPAEPMPEGDLRVFVTRGTYEGAFVVDDKRGVEAADAICQLRAKAADLGGTWIAWLSTSELDAVERVEALGPWRLVGGGIAFDQRAQLYGEPLVALDRDERGEQVDPHDVYRAKVWTGTRAGGSKHADTCNDWTSTSALGQYGVASGTFTWTDFSTGLCGNKYRLVCLEL